MMNFMSFVLLILKYSPPSLPAKARYVSVVNVNSNNNLTAMFLISWAVSILETSLNIPKATDAKFDELLNGLNCECLADNLPYYSRVRM